MYYDFKDLIHELKLLEHIQVANYTNYTSRMVKWFREIAIKNRIIWGNKKSNDLEKVDRPRGKVYWMDFGINIGSEFNDCHFCVVIKEFEFAAIVIPFSSVKHDKTPWKESESYIFNIGKIESLPEDNFIDNYIYVHQLRSVSKQRLSPYKSKTTGITYNNIRISDTQLDQIDFCVLDMVKNQTYKATNYCSDYY